ncbi:type IX secretion system sortase PorU [Dyadobacter aurulentus]|uniref:type IX secretion system sortase PorU n=1 Tax=Dyadobacter sp. UC 10 TaxID=2605428 RepID=UPI0011F3038A|nr:type IX secretion system sortase PorU [Dyadobacter sp. UC 10]KAA0990956.1 type IX secretion system sortase PorU [Dyadobacter sp. UC 10]
MHWWKRADILRCLILPVFFYLGASFSFLSAQSILSEGTWFKIAVTQTGVCKIDHALLRQMGVETAQVNPSLLRIFGTGGEMLPQSNADQNSGRLVESAILVQGEQDGKFDAGDAIYFYAESPHVVLYDSASSKLYHQLNYYSDTSYYYLTFGQKAGLRIKNADQASASGNVISQFDDYWYHEQELSNLLKSGRDWWGEYIGNTALNIEAEISSVVPGSRMIFTGSAIGAAQVRTRFSWQLNAENLGETSIGTVGAGTYDVKALRSDFTHIFNASATPTRIFRLGVIHDKNGQSAAPGYLNFLALQVKRELRFFDRQQIYHFASQAAGIATYRFAGSPAGSILWDISNSEAPLSISNQGTSGDFLFNREVRRKLAKYISFRPEQAIEPSGWQQIANQDIISLDTPDLLVVTSATWQSEAERLAALRANKNGLKTAVVTSRQIYNEYAGGKPDVTAIRNYVRHLYQKTPGKLKYLLLFGDATYDYKNLLKNQSAAQLDNWIPVYESRESLNPVYTYSSDDYFGFMEADEGEWEESAAGDHILNIGVGRLPVKTIGEAKTVVDKLIRYETLRTNGNWKNRVQFIADDGDGNIHQRHADQLAGLVQNDLFPERIFIDEYPQLTTDAGQKSPAVNARIRKGIDEGTLIINYTGHGGVGGWAEEQVLTLTDMLSARGMNNLPLLFTATCDFGRYDDPGAVSGAETMVLSPKGAAIGAISTTRPVFSSTNFTLSKAFYEALIQKNPGRRMGDFFKETKNRALVGSLNRNFTLLGDPSMRLAAGQKGIRWSPVADTLRALQKVTLTGQIFDKGNNEVDKNFQGKARVIIYDKPVSFETLGSEGNSEKYSEFRSRLFDGDVTVKEGSFICQFVVPKDIDYRYGIGRASIYAISADSAADASGQLPVIVGGSASVFADKTPPKVVGYINNDAFKDGDNVSTSSVFYARVGDESGINLSRAGIGHDMTLTINDTLTIILNDYFTADLDDYQSGTIRFPLDNLPAGSYNVRLKVWDTYTNFSEISFGFQVVEPRGIKLNALKLFPNPFQSDLSFELNHSRANEDVELILNILLSNGQRLGTFKWQYYNSEATISQSLDPRQLGSRIPLNIPLVYQLLIRSLKDSTFDQKSGRLIRSR